MIAKLALAAAAMAAIGAGGAVNGYLHREAAFTPVPAATPTMVHGCHTYDSVQVLTGTVHLVEGPKFDNGTKQPTIMDPLLHLSAPICTTDPSGEYLDERGVTEVEVFIRTGPNHDSGLMPTAWAGKRLRVTGMLSHAATIHFSSATLMDATDVTEILPAGKK